MEDKSTQMDKPVIRTPDYRLRVFISSTLKELAEEREAARQAIINLRLMPVMFESGARSHPSHELYRSYLSQSHIFIGIYWKSYGWVPEGETISGLEDEYIHSSDIPRLIYIKDAKAEREPALKNMLTSMKGEDTISYKYFTNAEELRDLVENDLALLLTEHFETARSAQASEEKHDRLTNVPIPRNPLIGRERELAFAKELLFRQDVGIITLIGPGGTGKSRFGLQIALDTLPEFKDGAYLVRLTPVRDPNLVVAAIAETFGIRETNDANSLLGKLKEYLRDKEMLLLLDNFEQVLEAASKVVELMESCPKLRFVVTSRAPLRVRGERELFVPPLAVPLSSGNLDIQNVSQYAAVELFIQRATSIKPGFVLTNENAPAIAEICENEGFRLIGLKGRVDQVKINVMVSHMRDQQIDVDVARVLSGCNAVESACCLTRAFELILRDLVRDASAIVVHRSEDRNAHRTCYHDEIAHNIYK